MSGDKRVAHRRPWTRAMSDEGDAMARSSDARDGSDGGEDERDARVKALGTIGDSSRGDESRAERRFEDDAGAWIARGEGGSGGRKTLRRGSDDVVLRAVDRGGRGDVRGRAGDGARGGGGAEGVRGGVRAANAGDASTRDERGRGGRFASEAERG